MTDEECPLTATPCRHCSSEHAYRPYMKVEKDIRTGLMKPMGVGSLKIELGHYCNNVCSWIYDMESCPIPDDLIRQGEMIEEYNKNKELERVREEKRKARKKVVKKVVKKPVKKVAKSVKKVIKKPITKGVTNENFK